MKMFFVKYLLLPRLITDKELTKKQKEIFKLYHESEDCRLRKLISYCLYRALTIYILVVLNGEPPVKHKLIDFSCLRTVIKNGLFKDWFFEVIYEKWVREEKWYKDNNLPIIACINNKEFVIDGNHRLVQQIIHNEVEFYYINVSGGWFKIFLDMLVGKYKYNEIKRE